MSSRKIDDRRRELARTVRLSSVEEFHDLLADAGVTRAFVVSENGEITLSHPGLLAPVKAFFEQVENPLKSALDAMMEKLTAAARRKQAQAETLPGRSGPGEAGEAGEAEADVVGIDVSGNPVVTSESVQPQRPEPGPEIRLVWSVERFERSQLDLEALRPYLTDHAIMMACQKHLAEHGPHTLAGAFYCETARPD